MVKKVQIIFLCLIFTISVSAQTTYYISSSSGNDSNSGKSSSSPWKNLSKVNSTKFYPGDNILFKRGDTWNGQWDIKYSGSSSSPVYVGAYGSGSIPILNGNNSQKYLIWVENNIQYITFENLQFENCNPDNNQALVQADLNSSHLIFNSCVFQQSKLSTNSNFAALKGYDVSYITIQECEFTGKTQMIYFIANNDASHRDVHHISILNNNIHDVDTRPSGTTSHSVLGRAIRFRANYQPGVGTTLGSEGVARDITINDNTFSKICSHAIWEEDVLDANNIPIFINKNIISYNINIKGNSFYRIEGDCIEWGALSNRNGKFPYSIWSDNTMKYTGYNIEGVPTTSFANNPINTHGAQQVIIENNYIDQVATSTGDGNGIILDLAKKNTYGCVDVTVRRNVITGCTRGGTDNTAGIRVFRADKCNIYDNLCYGNEAGLSISSPYSTNNKIYNNTFDNNYYGIYIGTEGGNIFENNVITNSQIGLRKYGNDLWDYNLYYSNKQNFNYGSSSSHDVFGDPKFKDAANNDYSILSGSAAIDKGIDLGLVSDFLGNLVVNKTDIGAYQYSTQTTSSKPSAPSLKSPVLGETGVDLNVTLDWVASNGASTYTLQLSEDSNLGSYLVNKSGLTSTNYSVSNLQSNTKYYWRVSASNSSGASSWSSIFNFTTSNSSTTSTNDNFILINAEDGVLANYAGLKTKAGSIGNMVTYCPVTTSTIKFNVNLNKSGEWFAWGRMLFESSGYLCNSFYIQVDNGTKLVFGNADNIYDKWHWEGDKLSKLSLGNLSAGAHTITVYGREAKNTVLLDQLFLTSDGTLVPSDGMASTSTSSNLVYAAENGTLASYAGLKTKSGSIGSKVAYCPTTYSTIKFNVNLNKSGDWYAWGRMLFESSGYLCNSFYLQVDNGAKLTFGNEDNIYDIWNWEGDKTNKLYLGSLSSGTHTITVYGREAKNTVLLDQLLLTQDASFIPTDNNAFAKSENDTVNNLQPTTEIPNSYSLSQNYPNPFNPTTTIRFSIPKDGLVSLKVYNILGAEVQSLMDEIKPAGSYNIVFNASNLASGIYLYKLITPNFIETKKMLLIK